MSSSGSITSETLLNNSTTPSKSGTTKSNYAMSPEYWLFVFRSELQKTLDNRSTATRILSFGETIEIINKLGLHARAAAKFVATAGRYESQIEVMHNDRCVNGKSIMGLMMLAAAYGSTLHIIAEGDDAPQVLEELEKLIDSRFGEE